MSAPWAEILPDAEDALRAVPFSAITVTTAPLAADTDAANPATARGGLPKMDREPEPWLGVKLVPDTTRLWIIQPDADEGVDDAPEIGPPARASQPLP